MNKKKGKGTISEVLKELLLDVNDAPMFHFAT